jgi:CheY-like chemotaxis protein
VGEGTTVTIYLPRHLGAVEAAAKNDLLVGLSLKSTAIVLVIEDELPVRMVISDLLSDLGYTVLEAGDARSGLKILEAGTLVDLLVTDVGLPGGMNGRQLADAARLWRPNLKVLFITGYAESVAVSNTLKEQGMQVMTKPFMLEALAARIQGIIVG